VLIGGWVLAIGCLVHAVSRRARGDEDAGPWVVFLATSLIVFPLSWAVAIGYLVSTSLRAPPTPVRTRVLEGVGTVAPVARRFWAGVADGLIVGLLPALLLWADLPWRASIGFVVGVTYSIVGVAVWGTTLGKRLLGLAVVDVRTGGRPTWAAAAIRVAPAVVGLVPYVGSLTVFTYLPLLWRDDRRAVHDLLAGTVVVVRSSADLSDPGGPHRGMIHR